MRGGGCPTIADQIILPSVVDINKINQPAACKCCTWYVVPARLDITPTSGHHVGQSKLVTSTTIDTARGEHDLNTRFTQSSLFYALKRSRWCQVHQELVQHVATGRSSFTPSFRHQHRHGIAGNSACTYYTTLDYDETHESRVQTKRLTGARSAFRKESPPLGVLHLASCLRSIRLG